MRKDKRVLLIGGGGTLGSYIINQKIFKKLDSPKKRELNLLNTFSIRKFLKRKYNLIEYLANKIADTITNKYRVNSCKVVIRKPNAPIKGDFDSVEVEVISNV